MPPGGRPARREAPPGLARARSRKTLCRARGVHAEAEELKALTVRVRRAKTENAAERQVSLTLNQALLNGVLAGSLIVDVNESGSVSFRQP